jgi:hypothetical protein
MRDSQARGGESPAKKYTSTKTVTTTTKERGARERGSEKAPLVSMCGFHLFNREVVKELILSHSLFIVAPRFQFFWFDDCVCVSNI